MWSVKVGFSGYKWFSFVVENFFCSFCVVFGMEYWIVVFVGVGNDED